MKKLSFILLAAGALTLASCSNEDFDSPRVIGDGNYAVTVSLPKSYIASRAVSEFGTGTVADQLNIAVYDAATNSLIQETVATFDQGSLQTTVYFNLTNGKKYNIAFFAQSKESMNSADEGEESNAVYTFDAEEGTVTVNYENMTSANNLADAYDCFYKLYPTEVISNTTNAVSVELTRPVGQVNWGTDDLTYNDEEGESQSMVAAHDELYGTNGQYIQTNLTVTNPYTELDLLTGEVSGNDANVTIKAMAAPYTVDFPMENADETLVYTYVAMTYLLAPSESSTNYDLNLVINNNGNTTANASPVNNLVEVSAVPVQANYQTNIYGNLLSDNVQVNVSKNIEWNEPSIDLPYEDMVSPGLYYDSETNTYTIMSAAGLVTYSTQYGINGSNNNIYAGRTVKLGADINMSGVTGFSPIYNEDGTFDGQGHTISNLTVTTTQGKPAGFWASGTGVIQNVNFNNVRLTGTYQVGIIALGVATQVSNVNVTNGIFLSTPWNKPGEGMDDGNNVGAIVGYFSPEASGSVKDCTVTKCNVVGFRKVGGLIGYVNSEQGTSTITNNTLTDVNVVADLATNYYGDTTAESSNLLGAVASNGTSTPGTEFNTGNTLNNVTTTILPQKVDNYIPINDIEDLQALANAVNSGRNYSGQTLKLMTTIDLQNMEWTPIGNTSFSFNGTFDGNNQTIKNLTISNPNANYVGLFGNAQGGAKINNLTIENASVQGRLGVAAVCGFPRSASFDHINITGNVNISGKFYVATVGGGNMCYGNYTNITVNVNPGSLVYADSRENGTNYPTYAGGVVGHPAEGSYNYSNITSNIDVTGTVIYVGGIAGDAHYNNTFNKCSSSGNVSLTNASSSNGLFIGGITGTWINTSASSPVTFSECTFTGTLSSNNVPEGYNLATQNNITGVAYSASGAGQLFINNQDVTDQHQQYSAN